MKSPKSVILGSSIYSIIIGVIWIVLSIYSLLAYDCDFDFTQSPFMYMLYLLYFKAAQCDRFVDWKLLGLNTNATKIQPDMPLETLAVFRTFVFSSTYLLLNIMLVITAVLALFGLRKTRRGKAFVFAAYFLPLIAVSIAIIVLDITGTTFYIIDYVHSFNVDGLMRTLEITNTEQIRPIMEQLPRRYKYVPCLIMISATSKYLLMLALNVYVTFNMTIASYYRANNAVRKSITLEYPQDSSHINTAYAVESNQGPQNIAMTYAIEQQSPYNPFYSKARPNVYPSAPIE